MDPSIAQFTKGERPRPGSVIAPLLYLGRCPEVPFSYVGRPPPGMPADGCDFIARPVVIHDARDSAGFLDLDRNGFELWHAPSSVRDFLDEEEVESRYVPELVELVLRATAGESAHVFDTQLRRREFGRPPMTLGARSGPFAGPAGRVHVDYTLASGARRYGKVLQGRPLPRRFAIVNVWRSIGPAPVLDTPLALCDARSVLPEDSGRDRASATPTGPGRSRWSATGPGTSGSTCPRCGGTRCSSSSSTIRMATWPASCPTPPSTIRRCRPTPRRARASRRACW